MKAVDQLDLFLEVAKHGKLLLLTKSGSQLYGTNTPNSDTDYKGVYLPSKESLILQKTVDFLKLDTNNTKGVCINDNGLFCIKTNDYDNSVLALKNHFGESACSDFGSRFRCNSDAFRCDAYSIGNVDCYDSSTNDNCYVYSSGAVDCD